MNFVDKILWEPWVEEPMELPLTRNVLRLKDVDGKLEDKQHARLNKMSLLICHVKA